MSFYNETQRAPTKFGLFWFIITITACRCREENKTLQNQSCDPLHQLYTWLFMLCNALVTLPAVMPTTGHYPQCSVIANPHLLTIYLTPESETLKALLSSQYSASTVHSSTGDEAACANKDVSYRIASYHIVTYRIVVVRYQIISYHVCNEDFVLNIKSLRGI